MRETPATDKLTTRVGCGGCSCGGVNPVVSATSLVFLAILGGVAARVGGASVATGAMRVTFWGALAMVMTAAVGALFGTVA